MTETELMLISILNCSRIDLFLNKRKLTKKEQAQFNAMQARRKMHEPLQYIIGTCDFMGIDLNVDRRVLIPRPETELLVDIAIRTITSAKLSFYNGILNILDIGTGSGNIAIALTKNLNNCTVTTIDISKDAIELARANACRHGVSDRIKFIHSDVSSFLNQAKIVGKQYDMIISNPPYIPTPMLPKLPKDVRFEPIIALDGGEDGLCFFKIIISAATYIIRKNGFLFIEIGDGQDDDIAQIFQDNRYYNKVSFYKDYTNVNRIVSANVTI